MIIKIEIVNKRPTVVGTPIIVCGNSGYSIEFTFDAEWKDVVVKTVRFVYAQAGQVKHQDVIFDGNIAEVPILSNISEVMVGVFAGDLQTTTPARIPCERSILCGSGTVEEPTPDVYAQIMALLNVVDVTAQDAYDLADQADKKVDTLREVVSKFHSNIVETAAGDVIAITDSSDMELAALRIFGKTTQNSTPTPDEPIALDSVGADGSVAVTVCGKNLLPISRVFKDAKAYTHNGITYTLNDDGSITVDGKATLTSNLPFLFTNEGAKIFPVGEYIVSGITGGNSNFYFTFYDGQNNTGTRYNFGSGNELKVTMRSGYIFNPRVVVVEGTTINNVTIYPMIRSDAYTDSSFEPYNAQPMTLSTPNGLPGIPVTSGGNYTDQNGQQWICDEVDFEKGEYVQRVNTIICDGVNNRFDFKSSSAPSSYRLCIAGEKFNALRTGGNSEKPPLLSDLFPAISYSERDQGKTGINLNSSTASPSDAVFITFDTNGPATMAEANAWLAENNTTVMYALPVPIFHKLSEIDPDALAQYAALHTNYPNTTVFNDKNAGMEVKYVADTKLYIDEKFNQLAKAMLNQ